MQWTALTQSRENRAFKSAAKGFLKAAGLFDRDLSISRRVVDAVDDRLYLYVGGADATAEDSTTRMDAITSALQSIGIELDTIARPSYEEGSGCAAISTAQGREAVHEMTAKFLKATEQLKMGLRWQELVKLQPQEASQGAARS